MTTARRLSDGDVRSIFESVHGGRPPPPNLHFQIVPVGPDGLRLSPPSYEFEDGLYILMKPQKKKAHPREQPKVPPHLQDFVLGNQPPASCPWSLSGPQFPQPTAIQQRYCYPKGDPVYSSRKGGALWTMYGADGKENLEFRLLHVYYSAKRAVNRGVKASNSPNNKRVKQTPPRLPVKPQSAPLPPPMSPAATRDCPSPLPFEMSTPPSPTTLSPIPYKSNFVSPPQGNIFDHNEHDGSPFRPRILMNEPLDHFQLDMESMQELEDACWKDDTHDLFPMVVADGESFQTSLNKMHSHVRDTILSAPESEQAPLVSLFTSWARQVAQDPLNDFSCAQV